ncbi:MAG: hypothetical protein A2X64_07475 [Ignavibacteria bacterium GWF2_33_9]|nr:MAG: hypothetical protein A2X64_07475 [Ignavibacteria bacterium GWF2_33_9]
MKRLIFFLLVLSKIVAMPNSQTENLNERIFSYLDSCYNPVVKCFVIPSEFDFIRDGVINDTLKKYEWDEILRNNRCTDIIDTFLQNSTEYKPIFKEFNKFWKFEIEKIVRKGYVYHLKHENFNFYKELDSLREIKYAFDSTEAVWAIADSINGWYIPKNLEDAFITLDKILSEKYINTIMSYKTEDQAVDIEHVSLGIVLRNNWQIGSSRIGKYFVNKGITIPDLISSYIIRAYYRRLNNKPLNLDELDKKYLDYQKLNEVENDWYSY